MFEAPQPKFVTWSAAVLAALLFAAPALSGDWTDPTPEELALAKARVEPGADAEAFLWEVTVDDNPEGRPEDTVLDHYLRVKIFTAAGAEKFSNVSLFYPRNAGISLVQARTVAPDGKASSMAGDAVFKTTVVKSSDEELKSTTFAIPNVTVGSIVEYRYRETRYDWVAHFVTLRLQLDIPVELVRYNIRPLISTTYEMRHVVFNATISPFVRGVGGFYTTTARNLPAFVEEPFMPPGDQVRASILVYYTSGPSTTPDAYWNQRGKEVAGRFDDLTRPNGAIKGLAKSLAGDGAQGEETLRRLFDWCRLNIHNRNNDALEDRPVGREKPPENKNAAEVLEHRSGTAEDINLLFAGLARAAGFDVRLARTASRNRRYFDPSLMVDVFLDTPLVAVRFGDDWKLFDPGALTVPFAGLRWQHEGSGAQLCGRDDSPLIETPFSPPEQSLQMRTARLRLDEDGTLEGDVHMVFTGHFNSARRAREADESIRQREQDIVDRIEARLSTAELSDVHVATDLPYDPALRGDAASARSRLCDARRQAAAAAAVRVRERPRGDVLVERSPLPDLFRPSVARGRFDSHRAPRGVRRGRRGPAEAARHSRRRSLRRPDAHEPRRARDRLRAAAAVR